MKNFYFLHKNGEIPVSINDFKYLYDNKAPNPIPLLEWCHHKCTSDIIKWEYDETIIEILENKQTVAIFEMIRNDDLQVWINKRFKKGHYKKELYEIK